MPRWRLACDACPAELWMSEAPAFEEFFGELQNLHAVLAAWAGDAAPLGRLLPERPRFLSDLDPPEPRAGDSPEARAALELLHSGAFVEARARLERTIADGAGGAHLWRALAVAAERVHQPALAEASWTRSLEREAEPRAHLARGALRARRGAFKEAREDLARAGDGHEARWNRAALAILEAVATAPGFPEASVIEAARREAGEPSRYWSDHTVGRLLWTLLVERAAARARRDASPCPDARALRAAERELEFETFWDRAMVLHGYVSLGLAAEAAEVALPLAREGIERAAAEPWVEAAADVVRALERASREIGAGHPDSARALIADLLEREDFRRYRIPCQACGKGSVGVAEVEETEDGE